MKVLAIVILFVSSTAFAGSKDEACNKYFSAVQVKTAALLQVPIIAEVYSVAYELNFNQDEMKKLTEFLTQRVTTDSTALDNIGKGTYFACTTDLTKEDKELMQEQLRSILGLVKPQ